MLARELLLGPETMRKRVPTECGSKHHGWSSGETVEVKAGWDAVFHHPQITHNIVALHLPMPYSAPIQLRASKSQGKHIPQDAL